MLGEGVRERGRGGWPGARGEERKRGEGRKEKKEKRKKKKRVKENGKIGKRNEEKENGEKGESGKEKEGGRCAPASTAAAVGHAWRRRACAGHGRWGTRPGGEGGKRREGKRGGEIRGGRTRRVALDGIKMGRELNSGVGLFRRNPGN